MASDDGYFVVTVEDTVIQVTAYVVKALNEGNARNLVANGIYLTESSPETVDTLRSEVKTVEALGEFKQ